MLRYPPPRQPSLQAPPSWPHKTRLPSDLLCHCLPAWCPPLFLNIPIAPISLQVMGQGEQRPGTEACEERWKPGRSGPPRRLFRHRLGQPRGRPHLKSEGASRHRSARWLAVRRATEGTRMCPGSCVGSPRAELWALLGSRGPGGWLRTGLASLRKSWGD